MLAAIYAQGLSWLDNVETTFFPPVCTLFFQTQSALAPLGMEDNFHLSEDLQLTYLAEGAANIVFRVGRKPIPVVQPGSESSNTFWAPLEGKLLRLRKDLPTTIPCKEAWALWDKHIRPLFPPASIVNQETVALSPGIIRHLNDKLRKQEALSSEGVPVRHSSRHGVYLAEDTHGLLITDMSTKPECCSVEFKPKWLVQSPNAPPDATRCRSCALYAKRRSSQTPDSSRRTQTTHFCPLALVSQPGMEGARNLETVTQKILFADLEHTVFDPNNHVAVRFRDWLSSNPTFTRLAEYQNFLDSKNVLFRSGLAINGHDATNALESDLMDLRVAMTLRDCSLFVNIPFNKDEDITARLGDLDLKSSLKLETWRKKERNLIDGGWYAGRGGENVHCLADGIS